LETFAPQTEEEAADLTRGALTGETTFEIVGGATKRGWGRPGQAHSQMTSLGLAGIESYEPGELVLTAKAGTLMAEITEALAAQHQQLAFEPPNLAALYGDGDGDTLGGVIACNLSGPRRIQAGAARDHVLGFTAIGGRGEIFQSGGRVVKNVTGFDMSKMMAGSFGTLGMLTLVTVRALPAPEKTRTVLILGLNEAAAAEAMAMALGSPHDVSAAAHLPGDIAGRSGAEYVGASGAPVTAIRIEGPGPSAQARCLALRNLLAPFGEIEELHGTNSRILWTEIGSVGALLKDPERCIWRLSVPPVSGALVVSNIRMHIDCEAYFDWGGGLIWLSCAATAQDQADRIRAAIAAPGGHATLMRAPDRMRLDIPVFQPLDPVAEALSARLKTNFDPTGMFNPGRMYQGV